jgi:succinoglycan biosynthesis protein ExoM
MADATSGGSDGASALRERVSVCVPTFQRNERLLAVLQDLARQDRPPDQIVVVDNDPGGGAKVVVEQYRAVGRPFPVDYDVQPVPNIAITRNRTVELATGDWMAFVDDDERAPPNWLRDLLHAAELYQADGVLAPVEPQVPASAPGWIRRGRFYEWPHQPEGAVVPLHCMRFGNVLLRSDRLRAEEGPFDSRYGLTGGEDLDLLVRLAHKGARIVWSEKAPVFEPVEPKRLSLQYISMRALAGGQGFARYTLDGGYRTISSLGRLRFCLQALAQMIAAGIIAIGSFPFGRHHVAGWFVKACANFGKLSVLWGWRYHTYARRG